MSRARLMLPVGLLLSAAFLSPSIQAATPASGTLTETSGVLTYDSDFVGLNPTPACQPGQADAQANGVICDQYQLTVTIPDAFRTANTTAKVRITTTWASDVDDYDIALVRGANPATETSVGSAANATEPGNPKEVIELPLSTVTDGANYRIRILPFINSSPGSGATSTTIELVGASGGGGGEDPPPPAEGDACTVPGVDLITDAEGDQVVPVLPADYDLRSLSVSEAMTPPASQPTLFMADGKRRLIFTYKVGSLANLPPMARWLAFFNGPNATGGQSTYFVGMTNFPDEGVRFRYGAEATLNGTTGFDDLGFADGGSNYNVNGTITIVVPLDKFPFARNATLTNFKANVQQSLGLGVAGYLGGPVADSGASTLGYTTVAANACGTEGSGSGGGGTGAITVRAANDNDPTFTVHVTPAGLSNSLLGAAEPTLAINPVTNNAFFRFLFGTAKVTFDDAQSPPTATWTDASDLVSSLVGLDPFISGAHALTAEGYPDPMVPARLFTQQLLVAQSATSYSDDEGETWTPAQGGGVPMVVDNQSITGGPYPEGFLLGPVTLSDYAVYYCGHTFVNAFCSRSDDGGQTYSPPVPIFPAASLCNNHGHVKVGADGTVYVPINNTCEGSEGVTLSIDGGLTWTYVAVPDTVLGRWDPSIAIARDGTTVYYAYAEEGIDEPMVIKGTLQKVPTPTIVWDPRGAANVGTPANLKNIVFSTVVAGDSDRAAVIFHGSTKDGDSGDTASMTADPIAVWHLYAATTIDGGATWALRNLTPGDPTQKGAICDNGTTCPTNPNDRNLLDFMDADIDAEGRILISIADGCTGACVPSGGAPSYTDLGTLVRQSGGPRMYAKFDPVDNNLPRAPTLSGALAAPGTITLNWTAPADGGSPITGYRIKRGTAANALTALSPDVAASPTMFTDTALPAGASTVFYRIHALNANGEGAQSNLVSVATVQETACSVPGLTRLTDAAGDDTLALEQAPNDGDASDLLSLSVAQPYLTPDPSNVGNSLLVFTLRIAGLEGPFLPNKGWFVSFLNPAGDTRGVRMQTDQTGAVSFISYVAGQSGGTEPVRDGRFVSMPQPAEAGSNFTEDGVISIVVKASALGVTAADQKLTGFNAGVVQLYGAQGAGVGDIEDAMPEALARQGEFTVKANSVCAPGPVNRAPVAVFAATSATTGPAPLTVNFSAAGSSDPDGDPLSYTFMFGDGTPNSTGAATTAVHTYNAVGTHAARVQVNDGTVSTLSAPVMITVTEPQEPEDLSLDLDAEFDRAAESDGRYSLADGPLEVTFTATALNKTGNDQRYSMTFGDGMSAGPQDSPVFVHTYANGGTFTARATVTQDNGNEFAQSNTVTFTTYTPVTVNPGPTPANAELAFAFDGGNVAPAAVTFTTTGSTGTSYTLDFGDGNPGTPNVQSGSGAPPATIRHTYAVPGSYTATLRLNGDGSPATDTATATIAVVAQRQLTAQLAVSPVVVTANNPETPVTLNASSTVPANGKTLDDYTFAFDFDDGTVVGPGDARSASHVYTVAGTYEPSVTVRDKTSATVVSIAKSSVSVGAGSSATTPPSALGRPVTVATDSGVIRDLAPVAQPAFAPTSGLEYPTGFVSYDITGLEAGQSVTVTITLPAGVQADGYLKCTSRECSPMPNVTVNGNRLSFALVDGGLGDEDGLRNGVIRDPGAPTLKGTAVPSTGATVTPARRGGGALGAFLLLPLMLAGLGRLRRRLH